MKPFFSSCLALTFLIATTSSLLAQADQSPVTPTKCVELFDGKSLSGWVFISKDTNANAAAIWSVTNGVIACQGKPNSYARTLQSYRNYKLHVEWRWPDGPGNSGVFLHVNAPCESIFNQCEPPSG